MRVADPEDDVYRPIGRTDVLVDGDRDVEEALFEVGLVQRKGKIGMAVSVPSNARYKVSQ